MAYGIPLSSLANGVEWLVAPSNFLQPGGTRSVYIYFRGTTNQVTVYANQALTGSPMTQPLTTTSTGAVPGYIAAEQQIDFFDALTSTRAQAEPIAVPDVLTGAATSAGLGVVYNGTAWVNDRPRQQSARVQSMATEPVMAVPPVVTVGPAGNPAVSAIASSVLTAMNAADAPFIYEGIENQTPGSTVPPNGGPQLSSNGKYYGPPPVPLYNAAGNVGRTYLRLAFDIDAAKFEFNTFGYATLTYRLWVNEQLANPTPQTIVSVTDGPIRNDSATVTNLSDSVTDSSILAGDLGRPVTGTGIPAGTYVGTVTAGVSFLLSSSATSQVNVNATSNGTSVNVGGGDRLILFDFTNAGGKQRRRIVLELDTSHNGGTAGEYPVFGGVTCLQTDQLFPPSSPRPPRMAFIGDSYTIGSGIGETGATNMQGFVWRVARYLGFEEVNLSVSGTGFLLGSANTYILRFGDLQAMSPPPDVIFIQGSWNDRQANGFTLSQLDTAIRTYMTTLRASFPTTPVVFTGILVAFTLDTDSTQTHGQIRTTVQSLMATDPNLHFIETQPTGVIGTLSSTLSTGGPITTLPVNALAAPHSAGENYYLVSGGNSQVFTGAGGSPKNGTTLAVTSQTPNFAYPSGTQVIGPINGGPWSYGTGHVGATNGSGPSDFYVYTDGLHPTLPGHIALGGWLAPPVASALGLRILSGTPTTQLGAVYVVNATNAAWPIPPGTNTLEITAVGGGGGGGGGGSTNGATVQTGGGGGGAGSFATQIVNVGANTTLSITVGGGGAGGSAGATGGNPGGAGTNGTSTSVTGTGISVTAVGGSGGSPSGANSTGAAGGGIAGAAGSGAGLGRSTTASVIPASGGPSANGGGTSVGVAGGGGGGGGTVTASTAGGGGGGAGSSAGAGQASAGAAGSTGGGSGLNGTAGGTASANTAAGGGGGGGGAGTTGTGGAGGVGGSGFVLIRIVG